MRANNYLNYPFPPHLSKSTAFLYTMWDKQALVKYIEKDGYGKIGSIYLKKYMGLSLKGIPKQKYKSYISVN